MYRVRLESGEDAAYRTPQELATAIRSGVVQLDDQVFHTAANAWIPIQEHPDYLAIQGGGGPEPAKVTQVQPHDEALIDLMSNEAAPPSSALPESGLGEPSLGANPEPAPPVPPRGKSRKRAPSKTTTRKRLVRPVFGIALPVVLAAAIASGMTLSDPLRALGWGADEAAASAPPITRTARAERARAAELTRSLAEAIAQPSASPQGSPSQDSLSPATAEVETYLSRQGASQPRGLNYAEAYADAQVLLEEAFDLVGFRELFTPARFTSTDSLRAARRMVTAGSNIVKAYRGQEVRLEQFYNPGGAAIRGTLRESFERAEATRALLSAADSLFGLLLAQDGRFVIVERQIRFVDSAPARRYAALRQEIVSLARAGETVAREDEAVGALGRLRRAIGTDDPPIPFP